MIVFFVNFGVMPLPSCPSLLPSVRPPASLCYLGAKAAWRALGDERGETGYAETTLGRHILHPGGTPHFLKAADLWYRFAVDPAQNRAAARDRRR